MVAKTGLELYWAFRDTLTARSPARPVLLRAKTLAAGLAALTRFQRGALVTLVLLVALLPSARLAWNSRDMPLLASMSDDGIYLVCAKSLAEGSGYRILSLPTQPFQTKYPPFYSWLLSWIWRIDPNFPSNLPLFALFTWALLPTFAALAWLCFKDIGLGLAHRTMLCAALVSSSYIVLLSTLLLSDLLFACLLLLSLILAERAAKPDAKVWLALAAGLVAGLAYLTKRSALPLLCSAPLCFWIRGQRRGAFAFVAAMTPAMTLWTVWMRSHQSNATDLVSLYYTNYAGFYFYDLSWKDLPLIIETNALVMLRSIRGLFIFDSSGNPFWMFLLSILFTAACVSGTIRLAKRSKMFQYPLFACPFVLMLLVWHYKPTERFIVPMFPLLLAGFSTEMLWLCSLITTALRSPERAERSVALAALACLFGLFAMAVSTAYRHVSENIPQAVTDYRAKLNEGRSVYRWISRNLPADATFLAERDSLLFLYTGRAAATQFPSPKLVYRGDQEGLLAPIYDRADFAREEGLAYYYIEGDDLTPEVRGKLLENGDFQPVYKFAGTAVYRIREARPGAMARLFP